MLRPCMQHLLKIEGSGRDINTVINELLSEIEESVMKGVRDKNVKDMLQGFKEELVKIVNDEEFKQKMGPIIKFRQANGYQFSLFNCLLIMAQDPEARMVKSKEKWESLNRRIKPDAINICINKPKGTVPLYSKEQKREKLQEFLKKCGVSSYNELTVGQKDIIDTELSKIIPQRYEYEYGYYDYRFTEQIEGKEDMVGNPDHNLEWFSNDEENEETKLLVQAAIRTIKKCNISVNFVNNLGGARGVSKSGVIDVLEGAPHNAGMASTLFHEFSHEILHQRYLKSSSKGHEWAKYFIGVEQGRSKVEQQAELCAWIIMRSYGYDMPTNINYVGIWGMDEKCAPIVFDQVSNAAGYIINETDKSLAELNNNIQEGYKMELKETKVPSGREIAQMVGCVDAYDKGKEMQNQKVSMNRETVKNNFFETLDKLNNPLKGYNN